MGVPLHEPMAEDLPPAAGHEAAAAPRGRRPENVLTHHFVRTVARPGRYRDGHGLYLEVQPSGSRSWVQRLSVGGRRRELGLGGFPLVSLDEARRQAFENRRLARAGGDPVAARRAGAGPAFAEAAERARRAAAGPALADPAERARRAGVEPTFADPAERARRAGVEPAFADAAERAWWAGVEPTFAAAAERVWRQMRPGWRNPRYGRDWLSGLTRVAFPVIGRVPVGAVTTADVIETLRPVWHARPTTARRVLQRIGLVMEWAVAMGYRTTNPCGRVDLVLGRQQHRVRHMAALPHGAVSGALAAVRGSGARVVVRLAFEFLVLTAGRSGEVRGAEWREVDESSGVWSIPASRMKGHRAHRVPLCGGALSVLAEARGLGVGGPLVFPTARGRPLKDMALSGLLKQLGIAAVPHGFRSSFRDWAAEETDHPREVVEAALAHSVRDPVEAAYARSDLFERRRRLMDDWGAYLAG